mmetsp:Transcript_64653/g.75170  ORF Transcript_64653/g.75170 Transcript_64653/m.75170 type:complete len:247 (-) Transcript_64653:120-860(-)|eukprot:CAMPEP_0176447872 /NCGR_PEP_ID=MMETSP0127-20121128/25345_1 /TAXON_ID=938130 /ORGANISM="Platyophrya macrostoma, Strain WH" /LENGTH=246 /DNA_ID=CAMNT_0017834511 /DNA_START=41 /DNA_END=781 /DNA_ORIENTATION=-
MQATKPSLIQEKQSNTIKNQVHGAISSKNLEKLKELVEKNDVDAHEEISVKGYYWTCLHYAAHFNATNCLEYLLKRTYKKNPDQYVDIVNIKTKEGWSPLMISAIYKSTEALQLLYHCGGVDPSMKDSSDRTAAKLAEYYGALHCFEHIKKFPESLIPVNKVFLSSEASMNLEKDPKYKELFLNGTRLPCRECQSNLGYIKYSTCCGVPAHKICLKDKDFRCPECEKVTELTCQIINPDKAFTLSA